MSMDVDGCHWMSMDVDGCQWMSMDVNGVDLTALRQAGQDPKDHPLEMK
jgi:hypothetical protein